MKRLFFLLLCLPLISFGQLTTEQQSALNSLFENWEAEGHPGGVWGVSSAGKTIATGVYGLANIEHNVPNTESTLFNVASISKQFTAIGIVRLEEAGKLDFDDPIHKYLDYVPDFGHTITLRHLLHHTSGLRSMHAMLEMAGWGPEDPRTREDMHRIISTQTTLNFPPGEQYMYCNTGYMMLAEVIEGVTNERFDVWMRENVFEPLGMEHTYVEENYRQIVPGNADSYHGTPEHFKKAIPYWGYAGTGNVHSNVPDMLTWLNNFGHPKEGWEPSFEVLKTVDKLNTGVMNSYAFGVEMDELEGTARIQHGGAVGGFRAFVAYYSEHDVSVALLTNFSRSDVRGKAEELARIVMGLSKEVSQSEYIKLNAKRAQLYVGKYWNKKESIEREVVFENDTLWYVRSERNRSALLPVGKDRYHLTNTEYYIQFRLEKDEPEMIVGDGSRWPGVFDWYVPQAATKSELEDFAGSYYSPELETTYRLYWLEGKLFAHHKRLGEIALEVLHKNGLKGAWPLLNISVVRDFEDEITGLMISNNRAKRVLFEAVNE